MYQNLTIHLLTAVPYSNLNRDDAGTPKRVMQGGALRALHSSQSIKRGVRTKYENASMDISVRSGNLVSEIVKVALEMQPDADENAIKKAATKAVGLLTKGADKSSDKESERSIWMSMEEITTAAQAILNDIDSFMDSKDAAFIKDGKTGSLAIAAFGRMFANAPTKGTEAAIAVSPGVTTHPVAIETDYFSTGDDIKDRNHESGATFLGISQYVTGTFYRTISIDKKQLKESWTAYGLEDSRSNLEEFVRSCIYGMPRGKENSTAPYILPALVIVEEQQYRTSYDFEKPVSAGRTGGYMEQSIAELARKFKQARAFDPKNFGELQLISGTDADQLDPALFGDVKYANLDELTSSVVDWILQ
ncbi:CRISPR system Cascade subunit CasC [Arcanobacterium pluranimalium]|uniref:type I-E CRISPR-associated protein Cas7/Cse4/CasC n=1 Tax=Arcanobacterium pluranimalium TaxID=108028 RepID=UPI0019592FD2|nr:type I-E CRISPR-associated protein Cas7/Cse4/CasC [Arcanobacterium pluranimalium]MBM7824568.1 CRISPR system Cascade subunit CasC [Arcanobacterium pluranimalium]